MQFCLDQQSSNPGPLPICTFIKIICREEVGVELTKDDLIFKEKYYDDFKDLNLVGFIPSSYQNKLTIKSDRSWTKNIISDLRVDMIELNEQNAKNISGITELLKALCENLDFAKKDIPAKGHKHNRDRLSELLDCIYTFVGKTYELRNNIKIRLTTKTFTHIVIGHISDYKIPRKGYQVLFERIHTGKDLLDFIERVIKTCEADIAEHFSNNKSEFNKTDIIIDGIEFGIHISTSGDIKTFYEKVKF